jgi:hypothetical protein
LSNFSKELKYKDYVLKIRIKSLKERFKILKYKYKNNNTKNNLKDILYNNSISI